MIRLSDQQAEQLADLFDHLNELFSLMNTFIEDASSGKINPDHAAQLRSGTASIMEGAAQVILSACTSVCSLGNHYAATRTATISTTVFNALARGCSHPRKSAPHCRRRSVETIDLESSAHRRLVRRSEVKHESA